ncbi:MAG: hypothetical protein WCE64_16215 [Bacteroidales bacterium]
MPQIIGVWCREEGHEVNYSIFTGSQKVRDLIPDQTDLVFISSFTFTAHLAYALSNYARSRGILTALGGPHARSYPDDASLYFDYVLGLTDKELLKDLLHNIEFNKQKGTYLTSLSQPSSLPGVRERWEFIEQVHRLPSLIKVVSMIGSFGCPYQCDFCIDAEIPYQTLDMGMIKEDIRFLIKKMKHPIVGWYDSNFGIRFNSFMENIESAAPPGSISFIAECSLSILTEPNVKILKKNGFKMIMPGIESWFGYGKKSKMGLSTGMDKVKVVGEQVNMILRYIPQVHTNFMFGFDSDAGEDPFTLTKRYIDIAPAAYPSFQLLTAFGQSSKGNLRYATENRIIPIPYHMMAGMNTMNIIPRNYSWEEFYVHYIDLLKYGFSARAMYRRFRANPIKAAKWITLFLSLSQGGLGKISHVSAMLENYRRKADFRSFMNKETIQVPAFMIEKVKKELGPMWYWLPDKSLSLNPGKLPDPE